MAVRAPRRLRIADGSLRDGDLGRVRNSGVARRFLSIRRGTACRIREGMHKKRRTRPVVARQIRHDRMPAGRRLAG
jgi:hypothetical protein